MNEFKKFSQIDNNNNIKQVDDDTSDVQFIGKLAKFPNDVKAFNAYNFLENINVSKKKVWYMMIEKQSNELQTIKYNYEEGVNLKEFVDELKKYYCDMFKNDDNILNAINHMEVSGNDKFSVIKNIPSIKIDDVPLISLLTENLIKLLNNY